MKNKLYLKFEKFWRGGRVVEGARLESVYTVKGIKGSNPFLSAKINLENLYICYKY